MWNIMSIPETEKPKNFTDWYLARIKWATNIKKKEDLTEDEWEKYIHDSVRTSHLCHCPDCGELYGKHPASPIPEHQTDDGTGRKVPFLYVACDGRFLKF